MLDELLPYYEKELSHLRFLGQEFAREYPKVAARLQLEEDGCADPHTERLIEAFAFLSARVHKKLDDDLPEIVESFLDVLYPHYLRPTPSLSIAQFDLGDRSTLDSRYRVSRHTELFSRAVGGTACRFRTCYDVSVWPIKVEQARFNLLERSAFNGRDRDSVARLDLDLASLAGQSVGPLGIDSLRFFLDGEGALMHPLHELLFNNLSRLSVSFHEGSQRREVNLPLDAIQAVGFGVDEGLIEYSERSFLGYRLLHEYFIFPEKFMFFDIRGLERVLARVKGSGFQLHFHFADYTQSERLARLAQNLGRNHFRLGCTPVINLFQQLAEPIKLTHTQHEYPVVADVRHPYGVEILSIDSVKRVKKTAERDVVSVCHPFFEPRRRDTQRGESYWVARRVPSERRQDNGTELQLRLVDRELTRVDTANDVLSLKLTCSNRDLPQQLGFGQPQGDFTLPQEQVVKTIRCLRKPTTAVRPPLGKGLIWRLISHLSLNHLSLVSRGREALLEILSLYNYRDTEAARRQINGIVSIDSQPAMTRIGHPRPAFVRGLGITLELDEQQFIGSGIYLFGMVLDHFFGQYCSINSFTQLTLRSRQREKDVVTWPPRTGSQPLV
ncbi:type VI secretion system baseplate subunit TssF [Halomonas binhaiensis]|uniref:Type VI secretion system baseplate subunit TssF n=1 Tax=Halomonas binhaiensis TaxID=2562282 RepID=A0A5C1NGG4_9GAMM|nr:type VI secretion system baseplate subunit TssF [Halomonas binhaiensis]QEM81518.1 type VI secretion system baseplate subunit TssF [Halomonas binhaiensis]